MSGIKDQLERKFTDVMLKSKIKKNIIFESIPDLSDNTKAVFEEMVKRGYNEKYNLIWELEDVNFDTSKLERYPEVGYIYSDQENKMHRIAHMKALSNAVLLISCNRFIKKFSDKQYYIHLAHGCAFKQTKNYHIPDYTDHILTFSDYIGKYDAINFNCSPDLMLPLGYPRCDELFERKVDIHRLFPNSIFTKAIYWLPTYRQHRDGVQIHSNISFPIIHDDAAAGRVNEYCKEHGVLLIVKPHPIQDLSEIKELNLSNLVFIDNDFLTENEITNYGLLGSCDALLSDYSSVYYDYLLCNRPIGLCWEDFEEYNKRDGFTVDPTFIMRGGEKLYTEQDLCNFINSVAKGEDRLQTERNEILHLVHDHIDNRATERVVDFIEEHYLR